MRHLVGFFLSAGVLVGCSVTEVGSMEPEDGGRCSIPGETATLSDKCTVCTCIEEMTRSTWSCDDNACEGPPCMGDDCENPPPCMGEDCENPPPCMGDDCENPPECEPGEVTPGEGECFNCLCDMSGHWDCPDIACEPCVEGEMTGTECMECVCNERGTWSCTGFVDGMCGGPEECVPGETYPADDGCNTCTCSMDGVLMCTMKFCGGMCAYGTVDCNADPSDGCETDTLTSVQNCGACGVVCTAPAGQMAVCDEGVCLPGGLVCEVGRADCDGDVENGCETDISSSPDNCGACGLVCMAATGETAVCNAGQCGLRGDPCWYRYEEYEIGEDFPARDGCNTCSCVDTETGSQIECTAMACECNPMSEAHYRGYVSTDPVECMTADFPCPTYTTHFTNECGCGCEQAGDCPDTYLCAGDGSMDMMCAYLREHCPWSTAIVE